MRPCQALKRVRIPGGTDGRCNYQAFVPCPKEARDSKRRFCDEHEQAYRELLYGILTGDRKRKKR